MATYYFKVGTGEPFTDKTDAGDDAVAKGQAVKADNAPDNTEAWRMTYNFSTNSVDVAFDGDDNATAKTKNCLLYTSPSPRDRQKSRMPSSA